MVTINPNGTYELEIERRDVDLVFNFPLACYGGATEPCNGANFSGTCELFSDLCECEVSLALAPIHEVGEWVRFFEDISFRGDEFAWDGQFCRADPFVMRMVRFANEVDELSWGFVLRRL